MSFLNTKLDKWIPRKLLEEWLLILSSVGLLVSSLLLHRVPKYTTQDWEIVFILWVFLVIVKGLENSGFFRWLALKVEKGKFAELKLILFTFFLSALITNDASLFLVVPLSILLKETNFENLIILETVAANAGSILSPFGNPQNLYLFHHYRISPLEFFLTVLPLGLAFFLLLILLWGFFFLKKHSSVEKETFPTSEILKFNPSMALIMFVFFTLFVLSVLRVLPIWVGIFPLLYGVLFKPRILKVDYFLLLTFVVFFGFTDNLFYIFRIKLENPNEVFFYSALISQIISNVPSAILISKLTSHWQALLWGVSVGGFGTLIASMANLISYRFYKGKRKSIFLLKFHLISFLFFSVGVLLYFFLQTIGPTGSPPSK